MGTELSERVQRFLRRDIHAYEHLEVLLLLFRYRDQDWSATDVGKRLSLPDSPVTDAIDHLRSRRLLHSDRGNRFRYSADRDVDDCVADLARAYDEDRLAVIETMSANSLDRLRTSTARAFADAFRLRRRNSDG